MPSIASIRWIRSTARESLPWTARSGCLPAICGALRATSFQVIVKSGTHGIRCSKQPDSSRFTGVTTLQKSPHNLLEVQRHLKRVKRSAGVLLTLIERTDSALAQSLDPSVSMAAGDAWRVIESGQARRWDEDQVEDACRGSSHDLLLHVPRCSLRFVSRRGDEQMGEPVWASIRHSWCNVLRIGLSFPGTPFGDRSYASMSRLRIKARTLTRYIADITRIIQGGGTRGPYVRRVRVGLTVSSTGHGYVFDGRWRFLVVEGPTSPHSDQHDQQSNQQ